MSTLIVNTNHITAQCANWLTEQGLLIVLNCWAMQVELCTNNRFTGSSYDHRVRSLVMLFFLSWLIFFYHMDRLWYWFQSILNSQVELMHLNCLNLLPKPMPCSISLEHALTKHFIMVVLFPRQWRCFCLLSISSL